MTPVQLTSLLTTSGVRAPVAGSPGVDGASGLAMRGSRTTPESHTFSMPVVRELAPRRVSFSETW